MVTLVALALMMGASEKALRLVPFVMLPDEGHVQIRVENPGPELLDTMLTAELVLAAPRRIPRGDVPTPDVAYYARLDLGGQEAVPAADVTRLQVAAQGSRTWTIAEATLRWFEKVGSAQSEALPCQRIVPPGRYVLTFWLRRGASPWWRSRTLAVDVSNLGHITDRSDESP